MSDSAGASSEVLFREEQRFTGSVAGVVATQIPWAVMMLMMFVPLLVRSFNASSVDGVSDDVLFWRILALAMLVVGIVVAVFLVRGASRGHRVAVVTFGFPLVAVSIGILAANRSFLASHAAWTATAFVVAYGVAVVGFCAGKVARRLRWKMTTEVTQGGLHVAPSFDVPVFIPWSDVVSVRAVEDDGVALRALFGYYSFEVFAPGKTFLVAVQGRKAVSIERTGKNRRVVIGSRDPEALVAAIEPHLVPAAPTASFVPPSV